MLTYEIANNRYRYCKETGKLISTVRGNGLLRHIDGNVYNNKLNNLELVVKPPEELTKEAAKDYFNCCKESGIVTRIKSVGGGCKVGDVVGTKAYCKGMTYLRFEWNGKSTGVHRLIWLLVYGNWPTHAVDHIDGDGMNNKLSNLRDVPQSVNNKNQKLCSRNSTGIKGVQNRHRKFTADIGIGTNRLWLGVYQDFFEACCVRKSAELKHGYHQNHGRR